MDNFIDLKPFLQWAGGKRQLLKEIRTYMPESFNTYYEPFIGAGAVFFDTNPNISVINDFNGELINCYLIIKNSIEELIEDLKKHINTYDYYYDIRNIDRNPEIYNSLSAVEKASRMIYLNKTCFNAIYRVNSKGQFNVPFANRKNPIILEEATLRAVHKYLNTYNVEILNSDFEKSLINAQSGDFIYLDPPYDPVSETSSFTSYSTFKFDKEQQIRLKNVCDDLHKRGCKFMLSNSSTDFILDLYKDYNIHIVKASRSINVKADKRGQVNEVLVTNY